MTSSPSWQTLSLLGSLTRREIRDRYFGTSAGLGWALLQPLLMLGVYAFVLSYVFRVKLPGVEDGTQFITFVAIALWPWFMFQEGISKATGALRAQAGLIRKTAIPRAFPALTAILATMLINLTGYAAVLLSLAVLVGGMHWAGLPLACLMIIALMLITLAAGLSASLVQLVWRDLDHALVPALGLLFYATPILYPLQLVPETLRAFIAANPLAWLFGRMREALMSGALPGLADFALLLSAAVVLAIVWLVYLRVGPYIEDML